MPSRFNDLAALHGTDLIFHREDFAIACPCRTPEGYRDPLWHLAHPSEPVCNEQGFLPGTATERVFKGMVQPAISGRFGRALDAFIQQTFGEVLTDDQIGIFPLDWDGQALNFKDWSQAGEDWIGYNDEKFLIVAAYIIPDPHTGTPTHHAECGLRLVNG